MSRHTPSKDQLRRSGKISPPKPVFLGNALRLRYQRICTFIEAIIFAFLLVILGVILCFYIPNHHELQHIDSVLLNVTKSGLLLGCEYVVTPWFLNYCYTEDVSNSYAWRQYKLISDDDSNANCADIHERIPCSDNLITEKVFNRQKLLPRSCMLLTTSFPSADIIATPILVSLEEFIDMFCIHFEDLIEVPLINVTEYQGQTLRAMDMIHYCPSCGFKGCHRKHTSFYEYLQGWPNSFSDCTMDLSLCLLSRTDQEVNLNDSNTTPLKH